jgi:hypothetical protein
VKTAIEETAGFTDDLKTATEGANEAIGIVTETIAGEADELAGHSLTTALEESTTSTGIFEQATSHLRDVRICKRIWMGTFIDVQFCRRYLQ